MKISELIKEEKDPFAEAKKFLKDNKIKFSNNRGEGLNFDIDGEPHYLTFGDAPDVYDINNLDDGGNVWTGRNIIKGLQKVLKITEQLTEAKVPSFIVISDKPVKVITGWGPLTITQIKIRNKSEIPDIYATYKKEAGYKTPDGYEFVEIADDKKFLKAVKEIITAKTGWNASGLDRAEMGMQQRSTAIFEPTGAFDKYAKKLGWISAADHEDNLQTARLKDDDHSAGGDMRLNKMLAKYAAKSKKK